MKLKRTSPDQSLSRMIMLVMKSIKRKLRDHVKSMGVEIPFEQIRILHVINEFKEPVQYELSDHLQTDKSLLLRQLTALQNLGYIMRINDRVDKRKKRVILTTRGLELVNKTYEIREQVIDEFLVGVSPARRDIFYSVLKDMYENAIKMNK